MRKALKLKSSGFIKIISLFIVISIFLGNVVVYASEETTSTTNTEESSAGVIAESDGSAEGRAGVWIRKAAGKNIVSDSSDLASMTQDELRFLGVYISNFFVPFGTELGVSSTAEGNQEDIVSALTTNLNYNEETAKSLSDLIVGLIRSNNKELMFCVSDKYQTGLVPLDDVVLNQYSLTQAMCGSLPYMMATEMPKSALMPLNDEESGTSTEGVDEEDVEKKTWNSNLNYDIAGLCMDGVIEKSNQKYTYGYLAYKDGDSYTPVFDFKLYSQDGMTACQLAYWKCLESVEFEKGYGWNVFDLSKDEASDDDDFKELDETLSGDDDWYKISAFGSRVRVDCFGNLIILGGNHQFVAIPSCMNPYVWQVVDSKGVDDDTKPAGSVYNFTNIISMSAQSKGSMFKSVKRVKDSNVSKGYGVTTGVVKRLEKKNNSKLRVVRGSSDFKLQNAAWFLNFSKNDTQAAYKSIKRGANSNYDYCISCKWYDFVGVDSVSIDLPKIENNDFVYNSKKLSLIDSMVFIDDLGAYGFDGSNNDIDFNTFNVAHYFGSESIDKSASSNLAELESDFTSIIKDIKDGRMSILSESDINRKSIVSIYVTYLYAGIYDEASRESKLGALGFRLNSEILPEISKKPIGSDGSLGDDIMNTSIKQYLYYLLNPTKGINYVTELISNKLSAFLVDWHNDMLGTNGVGNITGTTKYRGNVGYVTITDLSEIEWTANLVDFWESILPYVAIFFLVAFVFVYLTGILSLQRCIIGLIVFCIGLLIPVPLINGVTSISNRVVSNLYGEKFIYWAMVQHESYSSEIDEAATGDNYENYLRTLYNSNASANPNMGGESVKLRWQAPKKMASLMLTKSDNEVLGSFKKLLMGAVGNAYSGEGYLDDDYSYLYRSYLDISNFSRYIYRGIDNNIRSARTKVKSKYLTNVDPVVRDKILQSYVSYLRDRNLGYANKDSKGTANIENELHTSVAMTSKIYDNALASIGKVDELTIKDYVGINQDLFNFSIPMFNKKEENLNVKDSLISSADNPEALKKELKKYSEEDLVGLVAYGLYSESVYYYFSWLLYDGKLSTDSSEHTGYKNLLLGSEADDFFYNTKGNGELKDIMDMRSLFTYIIPYLNQGNKLVREWDSTYGIKIYSGVSTEEGHEDEYKNDKELRQKYWHNLNVSRLYNVYTPWADIMYDCSYTKPETIEVMGEKFTVQNPIDPTTYPGDRPMIFSRSEMADFGLNESDLTKVERLILKCNDEFQEALFELLNYHTFNDVVLNTAAAMECTFIFNKNFSETGIFGKNKEIYPQSFEISDFSYDAFLRFILSNSTGESMLGEDDFYLNIVRGSSLTSAIVMLVLDVASAYILPGMKIFFIILVFLSAILVILVSILHVDQEYRFIPRVISGLVLPLIKFFCITVGMAYVISMFMGVGNDSVTKTHTSSIQLGDPVMVMIAMLLVDIIVIVLYLSVIRDLWYSVRSMGKVVGNVGIGVVSAIGGFVTGNTILKAMSGRSSSGTVGGNVDANATVDSRAEARSSSHISNLREDFESTEPNRNESRTDADLSTPDVDETYARSRHSEIESLTKRGISNLNRRRRENHRVDRIAKRAVKKMEKGVSEDKSDSKDRTRDTSNKSNAG